MPTTFERRPGQAPRHEAGTASWRLPRRVAPEPEVGGLFGRLRRMALRQARNVPTFRRTLLLAVAVPLLGLLLAGWFSWRSVAADEAADVGRAMQSLQRHAFRIMQMQEVVLQAVDAAVTGLPWNAIRGQPAVHDLLARYARVAADVAAVGLVDPQGRIAASSEQAAPPAVDLSDRDYVTAFPPGLAGPELAGPELAGPGLAGPGLAFIGRPVISRVDGRPQVHLSRPHLQAGRSDGGVIVLRFRPELFETLFAEAMTTSLTSIRLVRADGVLLARYPPLPFGAPDQADPHPSDPGRVVASAVGPYGLRLLLTQDPRRLLGDWLHRMAFPAIGAVAIVGLMLMLTLRARHLLDLERDRLRLEARLRHTEKTAALGQLAAGVAHDFNNLLQSVTIGAEALQRPHCPAADIESLSGLILKAADRGLALTRRMLDFARREDAAAMAGGAAHAVFLPDGALRDVAELLRQSLGAEYSVCLRLPPAPLPATRGTQAEFETMLVNLALNARDAMPRGGEIGIEVDVAAMPGYLRIMVADQGLGMDAATLARAGEAFFTTKPRGRGTGLGLSMARGFAQRAGGTLELDSVAGQGTRVAVCLALA